MLSARCTDYTQGRHACRVTGSSDWLNNYIGVASVCLSHYRIVVTREDVVLQQEEEGEEEEEGKIRKEGGKNMGRKESE